MSGRRVAAVQPLCANDDPGGNLERADRLLADAARRGARLALLPELLACGYAFETALWEQAEPFDGRTLRWLRAVAVRHGMHVGTTFLEAQAGDFVNTFALVGPAGDLEGIVRKDRVPTFEAFVCRSVPGLHVVESALGRVGVAICAEALRGFVLTELRRARVDLVLMPFSASGGRFSAGGVRFTPTHFARELGIPVVLANRFGSVRTRLPLLPRARVGLEFRGGSSITDRDGNVLDRLGAGEGVAVASVRTGADPTHVAPPGRNLRMDVAVSLSRLAVPIEMLGNRVRLRDPRRLASARAVRVDRGLREEG